MAGLCKAMIIGNLGRDPEMRFTPAGKPVTNFSVAVSRRYTAQDGESREETQWFRVNAWNQLAERCSQYLTKGQRVYVEGRLQTRQWTGNDGQMRTEVEIVANDVIFLSTPRAYEGGEEFAGARSGSGGAQSSNGGGDDIDPDDLPF
jgi:single-strand DNA-binding protein